MIRRAERADLDTVVAMRRQMWDELHPGDLTDQAFEERIRAYYAAALADRFVAVWLAEDDGGPVGMVTLLVQQHPPRKHDPEVRGYVTAVFVVPRARRRGHARRLMEALIAHARSAKMRRLTLRTTQSGRGLYESVGFRPLEHLSIDFVTD